MVSPEKTEVGNRTAAIPRLATRRAKARIVHTHTDRQTQGEKVLARDIHCRAAELYIIRLGQCVTPLGIDQPALAQILEIESGHFRDFLRSLWIEHHSNLGPMSVRPRKAEDFLGDETQDELRADGSDAGNHDLSKVALHVIFLRVAEAAVGHHGLLARLEAGLGR
jgi:hypothetical protein